MTNVLGGKKGGIDGQMSYCRPFEPMIMTFDDVHYYVPLPPVRARVQDH